MPTLHVFFINTLLRNLLPQFGTTYLASCRGCWRKRPQRVLEIKIWPERVAVVSTNGQDANFASWQFFTCQNALWLLQNVHDAKFRVVAVLRLPQCVLAVFVAHWAFSNLSCNIFQVEDYLYWWQPSTINAYFVRLVLFTPTACFEPFFPSKAYYQFVPLFNLRPLIFGLKPFGWLHYITITSYFWLEYYFLFTSLWYTRTIFHERN
jgi:hypothetical protein